MEKVVLNKLVTLKFGSSKRSCFWIGSIKNLLGNKDSVELIINVDNSDQELTDQLKLVGDFAKEYERIIEVLYLYMKSCFEMTDNTKTIDDLKKMYSISCIELKKDKRDWWITFEPDFNNDTIYNFFPRLTLRDMKVMWSNLK